MKVREYLEKLKLPSILVCVIAVLLFLLGYTIGRLHRSVVVSLPKTQIAAPSAQAEQGKLDLNTATREELMTLSGIGEKTADAILAYREGMGSFISVEELLSVKGFGEKKLNAIRPYITVGSP